ncbi:RNA polymerase sporulation sigma factor SigH [Virgibacillus sp. W0181]|uniref:RNA polymerase sporulation sigma factor SigH n=1 Tax=Virgibacillus sp. W0181 TaxID=3391581 RepID=UPI003F45328E
MAVNQLKKVEVSFKAMIDEEVLQQVQQGNKHALNHLIEKYRSFVYAKAQTYFLIGSDREDVIQEGMIGLYKAIRDYDGDKLASFKRFAELCIKRQIITSIKTATRQKHIPLNSYVSLDKPIYDEESDRTLLDVIAGSKAIDPQELLINRERFDFVKDKLSESLSDLEKKVLYFYLDGWSYEEISEELNRHVKSVDNALQRVKRKMEQFVELNELVI